MAEVNGRPHLLAEVMYELVRQECPELTVIPVGPLGPQYLGTCSVRLGSVHVGQLWVTADAIYYGSHRLSVRVRAAWEDPACFEVVGRALRASVEAMSRRVGPA